MELRRYFGIIRRWLWLIVLGVILGSTLSFLISRSLPRIYEASSMLVVGTVNSSANQDYSNVLASQLLAKTYSKLLTSKPILEAAIDELSLTDSITPTQLEKIVSVDIIRDTQLIVLRVRLEDPVMAARLADVMATQLIATSPASPQGDLGSDMAFVQIQMKELEREISSYQLRIKDLKTGQTETPSNSTTADPMPNEVIVLEGKLQSAQERYGTFLNAKTRVASNYVSIVEKARIPNSPISPNTLVNVLIAGFLGLSLSIGIAFIVEYLDDSVRSVEVINHITPAPIYGTISRVAIETYAQGLITLGAPKSAASEAFRSLRTNIQFACPDTPLKRIVISSCDPEDGKSFVTGNLAVSIAQAGEKVIVVDADLRRPSLHLLFSLPNNKGLTTLLSGQSKDITEVMQETEEKNLFVITSGPIPPNPSELLSSHRFESILESLADEAGMVVIDSPPILAVADSLIIATKVDGVVLVLNLAKTRLQSLKQAVESIAKINGNLLGFVLNKVKTREHEYYYYSSESPRSGEKNNGKSPWLVHAGNGKDVKKEG